MDEPPFIVAVDCPSGVDCDTGAAADECLPADLTVTMAAVKQGLLRMPAFELVGELEVVDIGLPERSARAGTKSPVSSPILNGSQNKLPRRPPEFAQGHVWHGAHCGRVGQLHGRGVSICHGSLPRRRGSCHVGCSRAVACRALRVNSPR